MTTNDVLVGLGVRRKMGLASWTFLLLPPTFAHINFGENSWTLVLMNCMCKRSKQAFRVQ